MNATPTPPPARSASSHGRATRRHLLDVAGQVFAERGFADATGKEICARAGANAAAIHYHFGGREPLYEAVLVEAHQRLLELDAMRAAAALPVAPRDKLRVILGGVVQRATAPDAHWATRVLARELLAPSFAMSSLARDALLPKARVMLGLLAAITGLPPDDPALQRGLFLLIGPCIALLIVPRATRDTVVPALSADADALVEDMMAYAEAGLAALAARRGHAPA